MCQPASSTLRGREAFNEDCRKFVVNVIGDMISPHDGDQQSMKIESQKPGAVFSVLFKRACTYFSLNLRSTAARQLKRLSLPRHKHHQCHFLRPPPALRSYQRSPPRQLPR